MKIKIKTIINGISDLLTWFFAGRRYVLDEHRKRTCLYSMARTTEGICTARSCDKCKMYEAAPKEEESNTANTSAL